MRFFNIYQFLAPAVLVPLSYWLWWLRYDGQHDVVLLMLSMPVLFAYIIPGVGTIFLVFGNSTLGFDWENSDRIMGLCLVVQPAC